VLAASLIRAILKAVKARKTISENINYFHSSPNIIFVIKSEVETGYATRVGK
jgi:hypothetical protein